MKNFEGYLKRKFGDDYLLLAGGGLKQLSDFAFRNTWNDFIHNANEFTFASPQYSGSIWLNYRTASGSTDGAITQYQFGDGAGSYADIIASGFKVNGADNTLVVLAGGGTKALSDFILVSGGTATGYIGTPGIILSGTSNTIGAGSGSYLILSGSNIYLAANSNGSKLYLESTYSDFPYFRNLSGDYQIWHSGTFNPDNKYDFYKIGTSSTGSSTVANANTDFKDGITYVWGYVDNCGTTNNHGLLILDTYCTTKFQIWNPDNSLYLYKRYNSTLANGTWFKMYAGYADSIPSHTLWGNTFNGTLNLTNTLTVTPSVSDAYNITNSSGTVTSKRGYYAGGGYTYWSAELNYYELRIYDEGKVTFNKFNGAETFAYDLIHTGNASSKLYWANVAVSTQSSEVTTPIFANNTSLKGASDASAVKLNFYHGTTLGGYVGYCNNTYGQYLELLNPEIGRGIYIGTGTSLNAAQPYYNDGALRRMWHEGNDGSGSGLDADLLDGIDSANFLYTEQLTVPLDTTYGDSMVAWAQTYAASHPRSFVYNTYGNEFSYLNGMNASNSYGTILKMGYIDKYLRILRKAGGNWLSTDWEKISAGYADSAGNADTLDGLHYDSFLRKDTNDSTAYQYSFTKTNDHAIQIGTIRGYGVGSCTGNYLHIYERVHIGSPIGWGSKDAPSYGLSTYGGAWLATDTGSVGIGTTSPSTKLEIKGDLLINNDFNSNDHGIFFRSGFTASNKYNVSILAYDHNGSGDSPDGLSINGYDGVSFCTGSNDRNERMRVASNGNVGIGTTSPGGKLHIVQTSGNSTCTGTYINDTGNSWAMRSLEIIAPNLGDGSASFIVTGKADSSKNMGWMGYVHHANGDNANRLSFGLHSVDNILNILGSGNVGIGTTSPSLKLDVAGHMHLGGSLYITNVAVGNYNEGIRIANTTSGSYSTICVGSDPSATTGYHAHQWQFGRDSSNQWFMNHGGTVIWNISTSNHWTITGNVTAPNYYTTSDQCKKDNILPISESIRSFTLKDSNTKSYGFIAQELEKENPELVDSSGEYKTVNYNGAICLVISKLENKIELLLNEITLLKKGL